VVDAVEESGEQLPPSGLVLRGGVVVLVLQGGAEIDAGLEERAGLAD